MVGFSDTMPTTYKLLPALILSFRRSPAWGRRHRRAEMLHLPICQLAHPLHSEQLCFPFFPTSTITAVTTTTPTPPTPTTTTSTTATTTMPLGLRAHQSNSYYTSSSSPAPPSSSGVAFAYGASGASPSSSTAAELNKIFDQFRGIPRDRPYRYPCRTAAWLTPSQKRTTPKIRWA